MLGTAVMAKQMAWEISPMIGYNMAEGNLGYKDDGYLTGGLEIQYNDHDLALSPELSVYASPTERIDGQEDTQMRVAINAVYDYDAGAVTPFAKIGGGMEAMVDDESGRNVDSLFGDVGAGLKVPFSDNVALKLEAIYMLKHNHGSYDSNAIFLAGLSIAFGDIKQEEAPTPAPVIAPVVVVDGDSDQDGVKDSADNCSHTPAGSTVDAKGCIVDGDDDNDGIKNSADQCLATVAGVAVDVHGCMVDGDDDNDGVKNSMDKCSSSAAGVAVDENGCAKEINLHVKFKNGSFDVDVASHEHIDRATAFMQENKNYTAVILGYTDSIGKKSSNQRLSQKRAQSIVDMILSKGGIDSSRLTAKGMGEADPIANNKTKEGRAQNRRIEAILSH